MIQSKMANRSSSKKKELDAVREALHQGEKFRILGDLIRGFGHELNNPLTAVMGYTQLLETVVEDKEALGFVKYIGEQTERCHRIIDSFLEFTHKKKSAKQVVSLNDLIKNTLSLKKSQLLKRAIKVQLQLEKDLPKIYLDPQEFQYAFLHVLLNAQEILEKKETGARWIRIRTRSSEDRVSVHIIDNGSQKESRREREDFHPPGPSGDVGMENSMPLSLCSGIVREHGGTVRILRNPKKGTKVKIDIPIRFFQIDQEEMPLMNEKFGTDTKESTEARILVVDDEPAVLSLLEAILTRNHHQIHLAPSGEEALEILGKEEVDLIIADLNMPGMGGRTFFEKVIAGKPELQKRFIFITGDTVSPEARTFLKDGERPFLPKPFNVVDVKEMVDKILKEEPNLCKSRCEGLVHFP